MNDLKRHWGPYVFAAVVFCLIMLPPAFAQLGGNAGSASSLSKVTGPLTIGSGVLRLVETTTPSCPTGEACLYSTIANDLRMVDGDGDDHVVHGFPTHQTWVFASTIGSGVNYIGGDYGFSPAGEMALTDGGPTQTLGAASDDEPHGAHAYVVCKGDGATDATTLVLTVTGSSVTDAGVYVGSDSEVLLGAGAATGNPASGLLADCATDGYAETSKKWVGQITYTLTSDGGTFNWSGNYGFSAYSDSDNSDFTIVSITCRGQAGANTTIDIELLEHTATGWTYDNAAFVPGNGALAQMSTTYTGGEVAVSTSEHINFKRTPLNTLIEGSGSEGYLIRITTNGVNAIKYLTCHVGVEF